MSIETQFDPNHRHSGPTVPDETPAPQGADNDASYLTLNVQLADGSNFACEAAEGFRVVELIRAFGLPIKAECGGSGVCATCHVRVPDSWRDLLPPPSVDELAKLDEIATASENSRLACQIQMTAELNGLELVIDRDSLDDPAGIAV